MEFSKKWTIGNYEYFRCVEGSSDKCFGVIDIEKSEGKEIDYRTVEGWPEKDCEYQVGRLTCTSNLNKVVCDDALRGLLDVTKEDVESGKVEKKIADDGATSICHLGRLSNVKVGEKYRGKGIAKELIKFMKKELKDHIIFLHVEPERGTSLVAAFGLYKRSGFKSFKKNKDYMVYIPDNKEKFYKKLLKKLET